MAVLQNSNYPKTAGRSFNVMEAGWVKIYTSHNFYTSELVRQVLVEHNIESVLMDKQGFPYRIGEVEVYIHQQDFHQAIELIIKNEL